MFRPGVPMKNLVSMFEFQVLGCVEHYKILFHFQVVPKIV